MSKPILLFASFVLSLTLMLSSAAFYMSFDVYSKAQNAEHVKMCSKQKVMKFSECMKDG